MDRPFCATIFRWLYAQKIIEKSDTWVPSMSAKQVSSSSLWASLILGLRMGTMNFQPEIDGMTVYFSTYSLYLPVWVNFEPALFRHKESVQLKKSHSK